ncbi:MAG: hypothetical protein ACOYD0_07470 [Candidatus Nanopelagicales bacterium]
MPTAPKTQFEYESIRRVVVCNETHGIGDKPIEGLTHADLTTWRETTLDDAGVTPAQTAYAWRFLRSAHRGSASIHPDKLEPDATQIYLEYQWRKPKGGPWIKESLKNGRPRYMWIPAQLVERIVNFRIHGWHVPSERRKVVLFPKSVSQAGDRLVGARRCGRPPNGGSSSFYLRVSKRACR